MPDCENAFLKSWIATPSAILKEQKEWLKAGKHGKIVLQNKTAVEVTTMSQANYSTGKQYNHIQESERKTIERMRHSGASKAEIARALYRHKSSIGRELKRNSVEQRETVHTHSKSADIPLYRARYCCFADFAQCQYNKRRLVTGAKCKLAESSMFLKYMETKIKGPEKWSVDAAVGSAKLHGLFEVIPCTKTVYNWIDAGFCGVRNIDLLLKVKRKQKRPAHKRKRILGRSIEERPLSINERQEFAHWEGDGVVGAERTCTDPGGENTGIRHPLGR